MKFCRNTIVFFIYLNLGFPVYSIPNFNTQDYSYKNKINLINNQSENIYKQINNENNLKISKKIHENDFMKELVKKSYSLKEIENKQQVKNNFFNTFRNNFKDLSSTYVSPFGYPIKRAPDESLINCQSKECFE